MQRPDEGDWNESEFEKSNWGQLIVFIGVLCLCFAPVIGALLRDLIQHAM